jgi:hypothetical protein
MKEHRKALLMLSKQVEQAERRATLENDRRVREQTGTFFSHTHDDIHQGRFAAIGPATVVGSTQFPPYPAASAAHQIQLPDEPPLGLDNPALGPDDQGQSGAVVPLASSPCVEPAPLTSHDDPAGTNFPSRPARNPRDPGRPLFRRRI